MNDLLKQCALAYQELMTFRYHFVLGRKGVQYHLMIEFPEECFRHLAGLHKTGVEAFKMKKNVLQAVLSGKVCGNAITDATLGARWTGICNLKTLIESNSAVFRYRQHEFKGSDIQAEYLLTDMMTMFFIDGNCPVSIFVPTANQLEQVRRCPRLTTLQIVRERIGTGETCIVYESPTYRK